MNEKIYFNSREKNCKKNIQNINLKHSIKSKYLLQEIFSYLYENIKLKIIKNNKAYQKLLEINIENFKKLSGRYKIRVKNGNWEEYNIKNNKLLYKGQYKNGKRNGEGEEYHENGNLKFKGKYLNGYRIEGKGYFYNGDMFLKLEKDGIGMEFYEENKIIFKGEYFKGMRWNGIWLKKMN